MTIPDYSLVFHPVALLAILRAGISKGGFGAETCCVSPWRGFG